MEEERPQTLRLKRSAGEARNPWAVLRWQGSLAAMLFIALFVTAFHWLAPRWLTLAWRDWVLGMFLVAGTGLYSLGMFGIIERQERMVLASQEVIRRQRDRLEALREATFQLTTRYDLDAVLQQVVESARGLIGAEYAALAVLKEQPEGEATTAPPEVAAFYTAGIDDATKARIPHPPRGLGLLGEVIRQRRTIRLERLQDHPASVGFLPGHPMMTEFLGVPLVYREQVVGHLYLTNKPGGFTVADQETAELFSRQAAVVIAHAALNARLKEAGRYQERRRIAMELHDGVLQELYGIRLSLENLLDDAPDALDPAVARVIGLAIDNLSQAMSELRFFLYDLKGSHLEWETALRDMVRRVNVLNKPVRVVGPRNRKVPALLPEVARNALLLVQEALSNALRYSGATDIRISWRTVEGPEGPALTVSIADNGSGFDPSQVEPKARHGLANLRERTAALGGRHGIFSRPGRGTLVWFTVPLMVGEQAPGSGGPAAEEGAGFAAANVFQAG